MLFVLVTAEYVAVVQHVSISLPVDEYLLIFSFALTNSLFLLTYYSVSLGRI